MAQPSLLAGRLLQLYLGDGGSPSETFAFLCIVTTKSFQRQTQTDEHFEPDCANPDALYKRVIVPKSQSWSVPVSGRVDAAKLQTLEDWWDGDTHNIQLKVSKAGAAGGGTWAGAIVLTSLSIDSNDGSTATFSAQLEGTGDVTFTAAV